MVLLASFNQTTDLIRELNSVILKIPCYVVMGDNNSFKRKNTKLKIRKFPSVVVGFWP